MLIPVDQPKKPMQTTTNPKLEINKKTTLAQNSAGGNFGGDRKGSHCKALVYLYLRTAFIVNRTVCIPVGRIKFTKLIFSGN